MVEVIILGSDGARDKLVTVDYLWDEDVNLRTYGLRLRKDGITVRVNAIEFDDALKFCKEHQD